MQSVDLRFIDFPGTWQHFTIPAEKLDLDVFENGLGFDGSSIRGWQVIHESDMLLVPQPETAIIDPFPKLTTLSMICNVEDPITPRGLHPRPPQRCPEGCQLPEEHRASPTPASSAPRPSSSSSTTSATTRPPGGGYFHIDSIEAEWNRAAPTTASPKRDATSATRSATRAATSPSRPPTRWPTSATR